MTRTALLVGVARTPDAGDFVSLDHSVAADLARLERALTSSGYDVTVLRDQGRGRIGVEIAKVASSVPEDGTLLVYFTGHGVRLGDVDYLLPADALTPPDGVPWGPEYEDSLLSVDISRYLTKCRAGTVLWLVDACRDEQTGAAFGTRIVHGPPTGRFALMVGCDLDERCGYSEEGSFFTRGLAEAFSSMSGPQTVHDVYEAARAFTSRLAGKHGQRQRVQIRYATDQEEQTRAAQVCEGRHLMDKWRSAVTDDRLWRCASSPELHSRLQECLLSLVEDCARLVQSAENRLSDPWVDDDFAPRLLLRALPLVIPAEGRLTAVEVTALVAAVFLREGAWADRLSQAAEAQPFVEGRQPEAGALRRHLEQVHDQHGHLSRRMSDLHLKGRCESQDIGLWLVHRWIAERFETDEKAVPVDLVTRLAKAILGSTDMGRVEEFAVALSRLAAGIGTDPPLDGVPGSTSRQVQVPGGRQKFRERPLAALLRVAGALAVDVRTLPDVVSEHLGGSDPVSPSEAVAVVRDSVRWSLDGTGVHMDALCPHQAMHAALEEVAETADRLATQIRKLADDLPQSEALLLESIPARVTASGLRPKQLNGQKAYELPLLRFRLAQTEVRDLLMGRQLYGSPDLALRELYQNAMDACRYRAMRWKYLRGKEKHPAEWEGRISIVQGEDDRGRYVECRDNGVGMGLEQLTNTFTRAGSRFEQSRLFRQEQAAWLRHDPALRLYPNSRFGIGVFSYFMLADEMTIVTRQVSRDGMAAQDALRVEVSSSGSLFRILKHVEPGDNLAEGGTRVRLYLRDDSDLADLSCTKTLESLIAVSEFHLHVRDHSGAVDWEPATLYPLRAHEGKTPQPAVPGLLWWVDGKGAILCDGIATDQHPFGYVLNLTGAHSGTLSVSRKELQSYDHKWAERNWSEGVSALLGWSGLTMNWLWAMDSLNLPILRVLWSKIRGGGVQVPLGDWGTCDLDAVGVLSFDSGLMVDSGMDFENRNLKYFRAWRSLFVRRSNMQAHKTAPRSLSGYPVPLPGDADVWANSDFKPGYSTGTRANSRSLQNWATTVYRAYVQSTTVEEVQRSLRRARISHPWFSPPRTVVGDLGWCPSAFAESISDELEGGDAGREMSGRADLRGLVAASCRTRRSLGELVGECVRFGPLRLSPLPEVPLHHIEYVCSSRDLDLIYLPGTSDYRSSLKPVSYPEDVREIVLNHGIRPEVILDALERFSWLGWTVLDADDVEQWLSVDESTYDVLRQFSSTARVLDWGVTVVLAERLGIGLGEAENELVDLADRLGLAYSRRLELESGAVDLVPLRGTSDLVDNLSRSGVPLGDGFNLWWLAFNLPSDMNVEEGAMILRELNMMAIPVPADISILSAWKDLSLRVKYAFSGIKATWKHSDFPAEPTGCVLFMASSELKEPLGELWKLARSEAARFGLSVPDLPEGLASFRPGSVESRALVESDNFGSPATTAPVWKPLTMIGLARYVLESGLNSRVAYERLAVLRTIGAIVPELSPDSLSCLELSSPDERDLLALEGEHRVTEPDEPLVALDLVSIAGRLGEPISETWQRFVPYLPFAPEPVVSVFPDVIPFWQDFAILTKYLDGLLPAIEGRVDPAHVAFVAAEVEESERWVWDRLKLYEAMFELDLSEMPEEA